MKVDFGVACRMREIVLNRSIHFLELIIHKCWENELNVTAVSDP